MENPRPEKVAVVDEVKAKLSESNAAILTEYRGLKNKDLQGLRRSLATSGGEYKVYKNTLVRFAARDLGLVDLEPLLVGPTGVAFVTGDAVNVAKALRDFSRINPLLVIKGGVLGDRVLSAKDATALADVAPREVLLARLAGGLAAPMVQFAGLLQALPRNFAYGLKALIEKGGTGVAEPAAAPPAEISDEAEAPVADEAEPTADEAEAPVADEAEPTADETPAVEETPAAEASSTEDATPETES